MRLTAQMSLVMAWQSLFISMSNISTPSNANRSMFISRLTL